MMGENDGGGRNNRRPREGLANYAIQRLPSEIVSTQMEEELVDECCSICLDPFNEGSEVRKLDQCGHTFHQNCIDEWLGRKGQCPNCKHSLLEDEARGLVENNNPNLLL